MIKDNLSAILKYTDIIPSLEKLSSFLSAPVGEMDHFEVNRKHPLLISAEKGSATVATTWREARGGQDVTGAFTLEEGEAVIVLPGEYYIVRGGERVMLTVLE